MGVIKRGILGGVSGKVANVVGASWKGIAYLKSLPLSVANPRTAAQMIQRNAMSSITREFSPVLTSLIQPLWNRFAVQMSGFNHFVQVNIGLFAGGVFATYENFRLSIGKLVGEVDLVLVADKSLGTIICTFSGNYGGNNAQETDTCHLAVYNSSRAEWTFASGETTRLDGNAIAYIPSAWVVGNVLHFYLSMRSENGYLVSNSQYVTGAIVA